MAAFAKWCDFHDYRLNRLLMDCSENLLELVLVSDPGNQFVRVQFLGIDELQLVDLAMYTVIDEIDEIALNEIAEHGDFSSKYKWSILEAIEKRAVANQLRLWVIGSSLGLQAAILGKDVRVIPLADSQKEGGTSSA